MISILFEDDWFLVALKPSGIPSQATVDKLRPDFFSLLKEQLVKERGEDFYLGLHHRLDKDTSGLMIFTKTRDANSTLAELFKNHKIRKTYLCLTQKKKTAKKWIVENHLAEKRDPKLKKMKMRSVQSGGDKAITEFECLQILEQGLLIQARPKTGRMHQIRVHLSERSLGIFGDDIYASPQNPHAKRLMLHAFSLDFNHPFTHSEIHIEAPLPQEFLDFMKILTSHSR